MPPAAVTGRARDLHVDRALVAARPGRPDRLGALDHQVARQQVLHQRRQHRLVQAVPQPVAGARRRRPGAPAAPRPGRRAAAAGRAGTRGRPSWRRPSRPGAVSGDAEVDLAGHGRRLRVGHPGRALPLIRRGPPRAGSARPADHAAPGWPGPAAGRRADRGGGGRGRPGRRRRGEPLLLLGGGSNVVIADAGWPGTVVRVTSAGRRVAAAPGRQRAAHRRGRRGLGRGGRGRPWPTGLGGLECLSGIPGRTGATPVQNVGAYGVEIADLLVDVDLYDRAAAGPRARAGGRARAGLPDQRAQGPGRRRRAAGPVRAARRRRTARRSGTRSWPGRSACATGGAGAGGGGPGGGAGAAPRQGHGARRGRPRHLERRLVLHQPGAAGRRRRPPGAPRWPAGPGRVKIPAAWLIEHAGFRRGHPGPGGRVALSGKHVLALTNRGDGTDRRPAGAGPGGARRRARPVRDRADAGTGAGRMPPVSDRVAWRGSRGRLPTAGRASRRGDAPAEGVTCARFCWSLAVALVGVAGRGRGGAIASGAVGADRAAARHRPASRPRRSPTPRRSTRHGRVDPTSTATGRRCSDGKLDEVTLTGADGKAVPGEFNAEHTSWSSTERARLRRHATPGAAGRPAPTAGGAAGRHVRHGDPEEDRARHAQHRRRPHGRRRRADPDPVQRARRGPGRRRAGAVGDHVGAGRGRLGLAARRGRRLPGRLPAPRSTGRPTPRSPCRPSCSASPTATARTARQDISSSFTIGRAQIVKADVNSFRMVVMRDGKQVADYPASYGLGSDPDRNTRSGVHVVEREVHRQADGQRALRLRPDREVGRADQQQRRVHPRQPGLDGAPRARPTSRTAASTCRPDDAKAYYDTALYGDPVEVTGTPVQLSARDGDIWDWTLDLGPVERALRPVAGPLTVRLRWARVALAWARGLSTIWSRLTWLGRVAAKAITSATSSAVSGVMPAVDRGRPLRVAVEADQREVGLDHARQDLGEPHRLPEQLAAQGPVQHRLRVLGRRCSRPRCRRSPAPRSR